MARRRGPRSPPKAPLRKPKGVSKLSGKVQTTLLEYDGFRHKKTRVQRSLKLAFDAAQDPPAEAALRSDTKGSTSTTFNAEFCSTQDSVSSHPPRARFGLFSAHKLGNDVNQLADMMGSSMQLHQQQEPQQQQQLSAMAYTPSFL